jgi:hypothetical protein
MGWTDPAATARPLDPWERPGVSVHFKEPVTRGQGADARSSGVHPSAPAISHLQGPRNA